MKYSIHRIKFDSFSGRLNLFATAVQGNLSYPTEIHCSIKNLNNFILEIEKKCHGINFYEHLKSEEILEDNYYEFCTPNGFVLELHNNTLRNLIKDSNWRMIA